MAIDHRILQGIGVKDNSRVLDIFNQAIQSRKEQPLRDERLKQQKLQTDLLGTQIKQQNAPVNKFLQDQKAMAQIEQGYSQSLKPLLDSGNINGLISQMQKNKAKLIEMGLPELAAGIDDDIIQAQTPEGLQQIKQEVISSLGGNQQLSTEQRERSSLLEAVRKDPELLTPEGKSAAIALGLEARASSSAQERIATNQQLGEQVVDQKSAEAGATESGKSKAQLKFKPLITKAVKLAEKEATERGEVLTDLYRMEASLPGVQEVVKELIDLSAIATSTLGGRAFDFAVKESGFGSTKGADARAKLIAIVDNQVLPLLTETFGSAFTVQEGDNLKSSLVNPNASPSEKQAQLDKRGAISATT